MIGIDLDNTIISYEGVFPQVAHDIGLLVAPPFPQTKQQVKTYLRDKPDQWTRLQGLVYGPEIMKATPFPGVLEFLQKARELGRQVAIVSHKTQFAAMGPRYDLHSAARGWLAAYGLQEQEVYFEATLEEKVSRLASLGCEVFIDDLAKVFEHPEFPTEVERWYFGDKNSDRASWSRSFDDWSQAQEWLEGRQKNC